MAVGLADLLGPFRWAVVAKRVAARLPGEDAAAAWGLCGPTCAHTQPHPLGSTIRISPNTNGKKRV